MSATASSVDTSVDQPISITLQIPTASVESIHISLVPKCRKRSNSADQEEKEAKKHHIEIKLVVEAPCCVNREAGPSNHLQSERPINTPRQVVYDDSEQIQSHEDHRKLREDVPTKDEPKIQELDTNQLGIQVETANSAKQSFPTEICAGVCSQGEREGNRRTGEVVGSRGREDDEENWESEGSEGSGEGVGDSERTELEEIGKNQTVQLLQEHPNVQQPQDTQEDEDDNQEESQKNDELKTEDRRTEEGQEYDSDDVYTIDIVDDILNGDVGLVVSIKESQYHYAELYFPYLSSWKPDFPSDGDREMFYNDYKLQWNLGRLKTDPYHIFSRPETHGILASWIDCLACGEFQDNISTISTIPLDPEDDPEWHSQHGGDGHEKDANFHSIKVMRITFLTIVLFKSGLDCYAPKSMKMLFDLIHTRYDDNELTNAFDRRPRWGNDPADGYNE